MTMLKPIIMLNIRIDRSVLVLSFILSIVVGKYARWSFESNLIDNAIGFSLLNTALYTPSGISLWNFTVISSAGDNSAFLYWLISSVFGLTTYIQFEVFISVIFNAVLLIIFLRLKDNFTLSQFAFIIISVVLLNMTSFTVSKEPIQMILFIGLFFILNREKQETYKTLRNIFIFLAIFILLFRAYYIFMLAFFVIFQLLSSIMETRLKRGISVFFLLLISAVMFFIILKIASILVPDLYNELHRLRGIERFNSYNANTEIRGIFTRSKNSDFFLTLDFLLTSMRLLIPIEVLFTNTTMNVVVRITSFFYQLLITVFFFMRMSKFETLSDTGKISLNLFIAFVLMSAIFEPDFGTWIRHESVTLPLMLVAFGITHGKHMENIENESYNLSHNPNI